jgi:hypothetical protein
MILHMSKRQPFLERGMWFGGGRAVLLGWTVAIAQHSILKLFFLTEKDLFIYFSTGDGIRGLMHTRPVFYTELHPNLT